MEAEQLSNHLKTIKIKYNRKKEIKDEKQILPLIGYHYMRMMNVMNWASLYYQNIRARDMQLQVAKMQILVGSKETAYTICSW